VAGPYNGLMDKRPDTYLPALGYDLLTPLYDSLIRLTMPERAFKRRLIEQARVREGQRVLDLGCGTATLTLLAKETCPGADVTGLDGDPRILDIARKKAAGAGADVSLDLGMSYRLPYPAESFDRVISSLFFHHLTREDKVRTLEEVRRVLRAGGELHVADFGRPQNLLMRVASLPWQAFDGWKTTADNVAGRLPEMMRRCGFSGVHEPVRYITLFGTLSLYQGRKV
jgi:ubiquinone/menaquinone biosynthesis C-methylase UbiE